ncbi:MAG: stalk domain-containing protein [Caldisericota bacterium]|nr:stalk domain-containing protein [Caldisericota bacterium]
MKKILVGLIVFTIMVLSISPAVLFQTNIAQADSSTCHWEEINNGLYGRTVYSLTIDSNNTIYAGTRGGAFKSIDGANWAEINNGLTNTYINSLVIDSNNNAYAGTRGGGVFKCICSPSSPPNLQTTVSSSSITLTWFASTQSTYPIAGYAIYKGTTSSNELATPIGIVDISTTIYADTNVISGTTYYYYVKAFDNQSPANYSEPSNEVSAVYKKLAPKIIITLWPDNPTMTVNGVSQGIDPGRGTKPVIIPEWSRTVVPIRVIVEALGGTIEWDGTERKVTINFNHTTIELWIDSPKARINGNEVYIDPNNHGVKPIIINDRTMLPLRFVAESLGCDVGWDNDTRTITITYRG